MGKRFTLFDDLDDTLEADSTVTFSVENIAYELDLSNQNIAKLHEVLAPFIAVARKVPRIAPSAAKALPRKRNNPNAERDAIRIWASKNGYTVSDKGRVPVAVMEAYRATHPETASVAAPQFSEA